MKILFYILSYSLYVNLTVYSTSIYNYLLVLKNRIAAELLEIAW